MLRIIVSVQENFGNFEIKITRSRFCLKITIRIVVEPETNVDNKETLIFYCYKIIADFNLRFQLLFTCSPNKLTGYLLK